MWGFLVVSRCIFILIITLLDHRNTATTKKLDFNYSHLTSVGATCSVAAFEVNSEPHTGARPSVRLSVGPELARCVHIILYPALIRK